MLCKITTATNNLTCINSQHFSQATGKENKNKKTPEIYVLGSLQLPSLHSNLALNVAYKFFIPPCQLSSIILNFYLKFTSLFELLTSSSIQEEKLMLEIIEINLTRLIKTLSTSFCTTSKFIYITAFTFIIINALFLVSCQNQDNT